MSTPEPLPRTATGSGSGTQPARPNPGTVRTALLGYRVLAWTTGLWLIALCYEVIVKYVVQVDDPPSWIGVVHGWVYFVYLLFTANLAVKVRWRPAKTIGVLLAGTIPLLGIVVEHFQTRNVKAQFGI